MGWDYYTYMSQPTFFIRSIKEILLEEQRQKMEQLKQQKAELNRYGR